MADLYQVLDVAPGASAAEIRAAYLKRARALHPDRWTDRPEADRRRAERAMQDVNEAWRVLGDTRERARYDRGSAGPTRPTPRATSASRPAPPPRPPRPPRRPVDGVPPQPVGGRTPSAWAAAIAGAAPYVLLAALGLGIFVVTAFAGGDDTPSARQPDEPTCVDIPASGIPAPVPCAGDHDGYILAEVSLARACGEGRRYVIPGGDTALCLTDEAPPVFVTDE
ncbi:MAG: J domain-containing protein [Actinomycetota bacterium]